MRLGIKKERGSLLHESNLLHKSSLLHVVTLAGVLTFARTVTFARHQFCTPEFIEIQIKLNI